MRDLPPMPSLRSFLGWAGQSGQLRAIADPVALARRMTAVHARVLADGGPVLRFDRPVMASGAVSDIPVVVNLFGTEARVAAGLGLSRARVGELGAFLAALRAPAPLGGLRDALARWPMLRAALAARPRLRGKSGAPVQAEVLTAGDIDLTRLPVQTCWPANSGR